MILLSFDIEEFDFPIERGMKINHETQIKISADGVKSLLTLLKKHDIKATFYSTVVFAQNSPQLIKQIIDQGHELASHGYSHHEFKDGDYLRSREELEKISGSVITGYRTARMMKTDFEELIKAGYKYDSSLNPTLIPGRYNNLTKPKTVHHIGKIIEIPASVLPIFRFPLFWISFHVLPITLYNFLTGITHKNDGYINIYLHPWEFNNNLKDKEFNIPSYVTKCSGDKLLDKLERFIYFCKIKGFAFSTTSAFIKSYQSQNYTYK
ncbi:MAG: polysaccharide deacetylase family protein [Rikenellaceae bacterium]